MRCAPVLDRETKRGPSGNKSERGMELCGGHLFPLRLILHQRILGNKLCERRMFSVITCWKNYLRKILFSFNWALHLTDWPEEWLHRVWWLLEMIESASENLKNPPDQFKRIARNKECPIREKREIRILDWLSQFANKAQDWDHICIYAPHFSHNLKSVNINFKT